MSSEPRPRGPRIEVSEALPQLADLRERMEELPPGAPPHARARAALSRLEALARQAGEGDEACAAALAPLGGDLQGAADRLAALLGEPGADDGLYEAARRLEAAGRDADAALVLTVLAGSAQGRLAGMLGLAVLAMRAGRIDAAAALVAPCLKAEPRHPRACSVAGICELERGNVAAAQALLAAASRVARGQPAYRPELQIAQRALLLMHLR